MSEVLPASSHLAHMKVELVVEVIQNLLLRALDLGYLPAQYERSVEPVHESQLDRPVLHGDVRRHHDGLPRREAHEAQYLASVVFALVRADVQTKRLARAARGRPHHVREVHLASGNAHARDADFAVLVSRHTAVEHLVEELLPCDPLPRHGVPSAS